MHAVDLPPFASSAMDGFAVRAADLPATLPIVGESAAGSPLGGSLQAGSAAAISTGAVVPHGADAVVPVEHVVVHDNRVEIPSGTGSRRERPPARWRHRRRRRGRSRTRETHRGAHRSRGCNGDRRPAVCAPTARRVLATGSELVAPGTDLSGRPDLRVEHRSCWPRRSPEQARMSSRGSGRPTTRRRCATRSSEGSPPTSSSPPAASRSASTISSARSSASSASRRSSGGSAIKPGQADRVRRRAARRSSSACPAIRSRRSSASSSSSSRRCARFRGLRTPLPRFEPGRLVVHAAARTRNGTSSCVRDRGSTTTLSSSSPFVGQESHMIARASAADALVHVPRGNGELAAGSRCAGSGSRLNYSFTARGTRRRPSPLREERACESARGAGRGVSGPRGAGYGA